MALLIEHLDRAVVEPMAICPGPGELSDHLTAIGCPVVHIPLYHIKPRTLRAVWRSSRRIREVLGERGISIMAPDAARDALTCGLAKLGTPTKMVWFVRITAGGCLRPHTRCVRFCLSSALPIRRRSSGKSRPHSGP